MRVAILRACCSLLLSSLTACELKDLDYLSANVGTTNTPSNDAGPVTPSGRVCSVNGIDPPLPCGHPTLIDDMEDGDGAVCNVDGRSGPWEAYSDGTGTQSPSSGAVRSMQDLPECRGFSSRALRVQGLGFTSWGLGVDLNLASHGVYNVNSHQGFRFWAKSNTDSLTKVRVEVATTDTLDASFGGTCVPTSLACNDHYGMDLKISGAWVSYDITFADFVQEGWGVPAKWSAENAVQIHWIFKDSNFDVWIDDVEFR